MLKAANLVEEQGGGDTNCVEESVVLCVEERNCLRSMRKGTKLLSHFFQTTCQNQFTALESEEEGTEPSCEVEALIFGLDNDKNEPQHKKNRKVDINPKKDEDDFDQIINEAMAEFHRDAEDGPETASRGRTTPPPADETGMSKRRVEDNKGCNCKCCDEPTVRVEPCVRYPGEAPLDGSVEEQAVPTCDLQKATTLPGHEVASHSGTTLPKLGVEKHLYTASHHLSNTPKRKMKRVARSEWQPLNIINWADEENDQLLNADQFVEVEIAVTLDSGAVDHVCNVADVPGYQVEQSARTRDFVGPDGSSIKHHGQVSARMEANDTKSSVDSVFQVADVSRCLYSVSKITRNGGRVIFEGKEAKVYKGSRLVTTFKELNGLYVTTMKLKALGKPADFTRPARGA